VPICAESAASPFTIHLSSARAIAADLLPAWAGRGVVRAVMTGTHTGSAGALARLALLVGWGPVGASSLEATDPNEVTASDRSAARSLGGAIRPVVFAERDGACLRAFAGPAFLPLTDPLASMDEALNGIRLDGVHADTRRCSPGTPAVLTAPETPWLLRLTFPGVVPSDAAIHTLVSRTGLVVERIEGAGFSSTSRWLLIDVHSRGDVDGAVARLSLTHRVAVGAFRTVQM
jgi:hypothetical protein